MIRINRFLALCKIASRRGAEELINSGKVTINGRVAKVSDSVNEDCDVVAYLDKKLTIPESYDYFVLNKPSGVITAVFDDRGRKTAMDFLPAGSKVVPVGRLDFNTTGVLILTNDGLLTYRLTHPSFGIKKIYRAEISGDFTKEKVERIISGIEINNYLMKAERVAILNRKGKTTEILAVLNEGRKREIRELVKAVGCDVLKLKRVSFGNITCKDLQEGEARRLTKEEVRRLYELTKLKLPSSPLSKI